jgi:hypothetical protein
MEYILTSPKWEGEIRLKYHENGFLQTAQMPDVIDVNAARHMATIFPLHVSVLEWFQKNALTVKIRKIATDTSFELFWEKYNNRRGSKILCQQYWDGLKKTLNRRPINESDRQDVMRTLPGFVARYRGAQKEWQPLAQTYLHQRLFEAELENQKRGKNEINLLKLIEERRAKNE